LNFSRIFWPVLGLNGCETDLILAQEAGFGYGFGCCCFLWLNYVSDVVLKR
jgi:hypothetical protein